MWYVAWFVFAFESPSVHPTITYDERSYIELTAVNMEEVKVFKFPIVLRGLKNRCLTTKNNFLPTKFMKKKTRQIFKIVLFIIGSKNLVQIIIPVFRLVKIRDC